MDLIIEFIKDINISQLIALGIIIWFFYSRLDSKIEKLDSKIENVRQDVNTRIDKLSEKVEDIDRRLCRIEGSLSTHGHCLFNQSHQEKKAE